MATTTSTGTKISATLYPVSKVTGPVPSDAVMLTKEEALYMQWKILSKWQPRRDVWPFTFGIGGLSAAAGLSGFFVNRHYRRQLLLSNYGRIASYIPLVLLPTILAGFFHHQFVTQDVMLHNKVCPICLETRSMAFQGFCGLLYPMAMAPAATFHLATRIYSYPIPPISKELVSTYVRLTKPLLPRMGVMTILNFGLAAWISSKEVESMNKINKKMESLYNGKN